MFFDARAAKQMKAGETMTIDGCPGLRLSATASRKAWIYRYKAADGRMKQVKIGEWPAMPIQLAASEWQSLRAQREAGSDPGAAKRAERRVAIPEADRPYTVADLVRDFALGPLRESRQADGALAATRALNRLLDSEKALAATPASAVDRANAFACLDRRKATPTATAKLRSMLGAAWDHAIDAGRIPESTPNWWRSVMKGKLKSKGKIVGGKHQGRLRRVLQNDEVSQLLHWLPNMHTLGQDLTVMYLWTCTRGAEILRMRAAQITQEKDGWWWTIPKAETKNARFDDAVDLRVPLIGRALEIVQRRLDMANKSGWLFEDVRGEQYTQHDFSTYIYHLQPYSAKAQRRQGAGLTLPVTDWTPHNLRRTARTTLASLGCPKEIAEAIVGHMPDEIDETYNSYTYDKERRLWVGQLAGHFEGLATA